ncbi:SCP2 sterol-binding domain-containing protein [Porticoccaceae bacterium LTM1]|nr:SCP2 sterol-binding domain-containing protein [Porticoccaceae bacterium LTM1]
MAFLEGKWFSLQVTDAELEVAFTVDNSQIRCSNQKNYDVQFSAESSDLAQLACKLIDPDTLFFRRRLVIRGDTELGLAIKNLIDDIELTSLPVWAEWPLTQFSRYCERNNSRDFSAGRP